ncbi:MAG: fructosamine kinase family protein [Rhodospirillales bacterium]|nr:fructosamine kinase family protein [Rhodospirillales bacterium]
MATGLQDTITALTGKSPSQLSSLSGGSIANVYKISFPGDTPIVAKLSIGLELEARMLNYLQEHSDLPVPQVIHADESLLLMSYLPSGSALNPPVQIHAADLLAALHGITANKFGFEWDTVIGGLHQPNPQSENWLTFFRDHRLLYMGQLAMDKGRLPSCLFSRLREFCDQLDKWLNVTSAPALIHGDMWGGNVLAQKGQITGFVDPAIYYADAEIELAFSTLFSTFGDDFFSRYQEHRPLAPGFFEERRDIYNLYPLLVHVCLFGGSYINSVDAILKRFGI